MLSRRRAEGEPDYLREVKNEFMAQWDGIRYSHGFHPGDLISPHKTKANNSQSCEAMQRLAAGLRP